MYATGFTAYRTASYDVASGATLVFDGIITNMHRDDTGDLTPPYSAASGIFLCPVTGYYYFHYTVKSDSLATVSGKTQGILRH